LRLLIIDDDTAHGESLADLLNTRGHDAYFASSLDEARWLLDLFSFDLALIDFEMPEHDGPAVASALSEIDGGLRCIVMSARVNDAGCQHELGDLPFVSKPISIDDLLDLLLRVVADRAGSSLVVRLAFPLVPYRRQHD